jgi:hypothetical protein
VNILAFSATILEKNLTLFPAAVGVVAATAVVLRVPYTSARAP